MAFPFRHVLRSSSYRSFVSVAQAWPASKAALPPERVAGGLAVAAIEHEAFVEVDEEGTRAAAATGVAVADSHGPSIGVDRPFLFFIVDKPTGSILFLGRVLDPR